MVNVPYVPVTDVPLLLYELPDETDEFDPPFFLICETTKDADASASLSCENLKMYLKHHQNALLTHQMYCQKH